jgi:hypothetical protein
MWTFRLKFPKAFLKEASEVKFFHLRAKHRVGPTKIKVYVLLTLYFQSLN